MSNLGKRLRPRILRLSAVFLFILAAVPVGLTARNATAEQSSLPTPSQRDVTYCVADGVLLTMDIYTPATTAGAPAPAAMFVHGGGWTGGDKTTEEAALEMTDLLNRGYLVASINYRLAPQYIFPSQIHDVKCAVRFLRANAAALNIDPNHIGAWGSSAGGHLVSLLGTTDASANMEGDGGYPEQSSRVQAVVDMYGRADLSPVSQTRPDLLPIFGGESNLVRYSPVTYVSKDDPPFLILHGDRDTVVPPELSQEFYERLTAAGVPATLTMVKNAGHGFPQSSNSISPSRPEITRMVGDFFDRCLKTGPKPSGTTTTAATPGPANRQTNNAQALPDGGESVKLPQTGKSVRSVFLNYWRKHGSIAQQGFPISNELPEVSATDGKVYTVQYFERTVLEYHAENQPPYNVLAALMGSQRYRARYPNGAPGQRPNDTEGSVLFEQTGRRLGGAFLEYWQEHGGVMEQGYPISDEFTEVNTLNGKMYIVQYFERAVFELHPENDEANQVLLSQLGTFRYRTMYGSTAPNSP